MRDFPRWRSGVAEALFVAAVLMGARVILLLLFATVHRTLGDNGDKLRLIHSLQSERYSQSDFHASLAAIYE